MTKIENSVVYDHTRTTSIISRHQHQQPYQTRILGESTLGQAVCDLYTQPDRGSLEMIACPILLTSTITDLQIFRWLISIVANFFVFVYTKHNLKSSNGYVSKRLISPKDVGTYKPATRRSAALSTSPTILDDLRLELVDIM